MRGEIAYSDFGGLFGALLGFGYSCVAVMVAERASVVESVSYPGFGALAGILASPYFDGMVIYVSCIGAALGIVALVVRLNPIGETNTE